MLKPILSFALFMIGTLPLLAQNPNTACFPATVCNDNQLFVANNRPAVQKTLNGTINNSINTIVLSAGAGWRAPIIITIDSEVIYCSTLATNTLTGCARGQEGTTAITHTTGANIYNYLTQGYTNQITAEIKGIESTLAARSFDFVAGGGTAQAQTVTMIPAIASLTAGLHLRWLPSNANTGAAPTLAVNGQAAKPITKQGTVALVANDLVTTAIAEVTYDGTEFQLLNPQTSGPGGGVSSLTGDGGLINNSAATGGVTITLAAALAHKWWGNPTGATGAPGYSLLGTGDLPAVTVFNNQANTFSAGLQNFGAAQLLVPVGTANPGTCTVGQVFFRSDLIAGQNWEFCTTTNTWVQQLNSGGGGGGNTYTPVATSTTPIFTRSTANQIWATTISTSNSTGSTSGVTAGDFLVFNITQCATAGGCNFTWPTGFAEACPIASGNAFTGIANLGIKQTFYWDGVAAHAVTPCTTTAAAPGAGILRGDSPNATELSGDVTTSGSNAVTIAALAVGTSKIANNAVPSSKMAVVNTRRVCDIAIGDETAAVITSGQLGPQKRICYIPAASTIVEMDVSADGGTPNVIVGNNAAGTVTNIVSGALATAASGAIACSNTGGTTGIDGVTTCTNTLQNTALAAGSYLELVSGAAGGTAKLMTIHIIYVLN